jgi:chromatin segregation and condensation protein Rec8/ScpA/Scc1 (kleisin family)
MKIEIQKREVVDDRIVVTVAVKDGKDELFGRTFTVRSRNELDRTLRNLLAERQRVEQEAEGIEVGEWTAPIEPTPEPPKEPTAKEVQERKVSEAEQAYNEALERVKDAVKTNEAVPNLIDAHTMGLLRHAVQEAFHILNTERHTLTNLR